MGSIWLVLGLCVMLGGAAYAKTATEWKSRIVYQLLTDRFATTGDSSTECKDLLNWCGGNFRGIIEKLDYIQHLGANAIWISPIVLNTPGGYHGYWAKDLYDIEPHFGTKQDLHDLIKACHDRDIWVMIDVVANHMGYPHGCGDPTKEGTPECDDTQLTNFTGFTPFDSPLHYHEMCHINFTAPGPSQIELEECRLANLPDLNQTVPSVRQSLYDWIANMTEEWAPDGFRVDTVRHIELNFWAQFQESAGVFCIGEVWDERSEYCATYQKEMDSLVNFPLQYALNDVFKDGKSMTAITTSLQDQRTHFPDTTVLGLWVDNHDVNRFLNYTTTDQSLYQNALAYVLMGEGIPLIYYGSEQGFSGGHDPDCRESLWPHYNEEAPLYQFIKDVASFKQQHMVAIVAGVQEEPYVADSGLVFTRAANQVLVALTNVGNGNSAEIQMQNFTETDGTVYVNIRNSEDHITVQNQELTIQLQNGEPKIYHRDSDAGDAATNLQGLSSLTVLMLIVLRFGV